MASGAKQVKPAFDPAAFESFRFTARELDADGHVALRYALDDRIEFVEELDLPIARPLSSSERERADGLLALLHWVAGVSYYKTALPPLVACESGIPGPDTAELLQALYSEGLAELAYTNRLARIPRPRFAHDGEAGAARASGEAGAAGASGAGAAGASVDAGAGEASADPQRVLVPVGGGKDSAVALEIVRRSGRELALFSLGDAPPIARTVAVAGLPRLLARRRLDSALHELNVAGALNGHVPITAIVSCVALLTAQLHGFDAVAMANERSASSGNVRWDGVEVNHQFSKGIRAERLMRRALAEMSAEVQLFSVLRPASELTIARAFARMERYHAAFTSCNAIFRSDPARRSSSWCCDCPKCRFVFLALAPFSSPEHMREVFGLDLLADERQLEGFALLTATGGHKPFECVGEEQESLAAIRLLASDPRWREHSVVRRLAAEVLPGQPTQAGDQAGQSPQAGDPAAVLALAEDHAVPPSLMTDVRAVLGA